jgi:hypothetical protein
MDDPTALFAAAAAIVAGIALAAWTGLRAWRGWLELKRLEMERGPRPDPLPAGAAMGRIELADLKARVRKLEAIADGADG